jgi:hypothetical protein
MNSVREFNEFIEARFYNYWDEKTFKERFTNFILSPDQIDYIFEQVVPVWMIEHVIQQLSSGTHDCIVDDAVQKALFIITHDTSVAIDLRDKIKSFLKKDFTNDLCFYMTCMRKGQENTPIQIFPEALFKSLKKRERSKFLNLLISFIHESEFPLSLIPGFFNYDRDFLLLLSSIIWGMENESIEHYKKQVILAGLDSDLTFLISLMDDGSMMLILGSGKFEKNQVFWESYLSKAYNNLGQEIAYSIIPEELKQNIRFNRLIISKMYGYYTDIAYEMKSDKAICKTVLMRDGRLLEIMPEEIRNNKKLTFIAITQNSQAIRYISDNLTYDKAYLKKVIDANSDALNYAIPRIKHLYLN